MSAEIPANIAARGCFVVIASLREASGAFLDRPPGGFEQRRWNLVGYALLVTPCPVLVLPVMR